MRMLIATALGCLVLCGCKPKPEAQVQPNTQSSTVGNVQPMAAGAPATGGGTNDSGNIAPLGPNIGGMTPVAGGENLGGGTGGGIGNAAKDMARKAATQSSQPASNTDGD